MWPCNSIISAFVWFVTHGKWTQNFQCGCCRILFKVSYPCRFQSNSIPLDGIPEGMGELFPMRKRDTGALLDLGTVVVSLESSRLPGTGLWWNTLSAPEPRKPLPVKRSFSIILVCSLRLLCFPVGLSISKDDSQAMRAAVTWDVPSLTWGGEVASPGVWTRVPNSLQQPPKPSSPWDSRGASVLALLLTTPINGCCSTAGALKTSSDKQEIVSQQNQECHEFL